MAAGIDTRHRKTCTARRDDGKCCGATYQAHVFDARSGKRLRKTFPTRAAAKTWRQDALVALRNGTMSAPTKTTVAQAAQALTAGMKAGAILDRSGKPYKPATTRSYERALRLRIVPMIGARRVSDLERRDVQRLVEAWTAEGLSASTVQNTLNPLQVICRRAVHSGERPTDPTDGLLLPRVRGRRERVASRQEAQTLIEALPAAERALWATAFYAGLRRGELRALRWADIDLAAEPAVIYVTRTWDDDEGEVEVKSEAGLRTVPLTGTLRRLLAEHGLATKRAGADLVFGRAATAPFTSSTVQARADRAWRAAGLERITPHEGRHSAASYLIEAGLNDLELTATIGHSDPRTTKMIYGHLFPDSTATIAAKLDAYHEPAT